MQHRQGSIAQLGNVVNDGTQVALSALCPLAEVAHFAQHSVRLDGKLGHGLGDLGQGAPLPLGVIDSALQLCRDCLRGLA